MSETTIYIVDRVVLHPGSAPAFIDAYKREYAPRARQRGLHLDRILVSPPAWIEGEVNIVTVTWAVNGTQEWWSAAIKGRHDSGAADWWAAMSPMIVERSRSMAANTYDVEDLCNV